MNGLTFELSATFCVLSTLWLPLSPVAAVEFSIGALVSNDTVLSSFKRIVSSISDEINGASVSFVARGELLSLNALRATEQVCSLFNATEGKLIALIVSHPHGAHGAPPLSVSLTTSFYFVPTIGTSARQAAFSDKYSHSSFLRTVPSYSQEANIWADLIIAFGWKEVCVIHSDDQDAKSLLSGLERAAVKKYSTERRFKIMRQVIINTDEEDAARMKDFVSLLRPVQNEQTRVILLFLRRTFAEYVFAAARKLRMLDSEWAWIVTEHALPSSNIPQGVIGVRLLQSNELDHVVDAVRVATQGIMSMLRAHPDLMDSLRSVSTCKEDPLQIQSHSGRSGQVYEWHEYASKLYRYMLQVNFTDGRTGRVEFDEHGDRLRPIYEIVNAQFVDDRPLKTDQEEHSPEKPGYTFKRPELVPVGKYGIYQLPPPEWHADISYPDIIEINMSALIWPGNNLVRRNQLICVKRDSAGKCHQTEKRLIPSAPLSFKKKTHLRVVTAVNIPFVNTRPKPPNGKCNESDDPSLPKMEVGCSHTDPSSGLTKHFCCYGYCIDLLRHLANRTGSELSPTLFTYELRLVGDGQIGEEIVENDTRRWTGIVGEILSGQADLAVGPISITPERAARVEFSKPFKYLGITILVKRERAKSNLGSFLQPFENTLWVLVALSVHVIACVLYLLDRFSPFRNKDATKTVTPAIMSSDHDYEDICSAAIRKRHSIETNRSSSENDESLNLTSAVYFAWGVLLNSGIGEGTPRSFSARVLGMVWAGFAMIIGASYTANLAAFLVLDRPESSISGIDDARMRNPQKDFTFATVRGSHVEMYFKRQTEYSTMYRVMQSLNYLTVEQAVEAVKSGRLKAFIWDSARLNYEAAMNCDLITAGEIFGRTGYGLVMKKGNPWLEELSQAVLNFHERGIMEKLDSRWIHVSPEDCERTESSPATLGLSNMAGVFIMIGAGLVIGILITLAEIVCRRRRHVRIRNTHLATNAVHRWRESIKKKKQLKESNRNSLCSNLDAVSHSYAAKPPNL